MMTEPREKLRGFISDTFFVDDFKDDDSFLKSRIIDSTGMLELVAFVEQEFNFKVADNELVPENLDSINNLLRYVNTKRST